MPVGDALLGRVVNALGAPIDGRGAVLTTETRPVESPAFGIIARQSVNQTIADRYQGYRLYDTYRQRSA